MKLDERIEAATTELGRWMPDLARRHAELIASNVVLKAAPEVFGITPPSTSPAPEPSS